MILGGLAQPFKQTNKAGAGPGYFSGSMCPIFGST